MFSRFLNKTASLHKHYTLFSPASRSSEIIRVISIDHDGCLGYRYVPPSEVALMHPSFVELLAEEKKIHRFSNDYVLSFSNRQSIRRDCLNAIHNHNNLAFPVATAFAKTIGAYFDPLLLSDIAAEKKPGFTISRLRDAATKKGMNIMREELSEEDLEYLASAHEIDFVFSEDKINILYAQMHRIALLHPSAFIHFYIYDDLMQQVLEPCISFYTKNRGLIPKNLILYAHHYDTLNEQVDLPTLFCTIEGIGEIDKSYYSTISGMGRIAHEVEGEISKYKMSEYLSLQRMEEILCDKSTINQLHP